MDIHRHKNLVEISQFIGFMTSLCIFFLSIDFLKENNAFSPILFFIGPMIAVVIIRLIIIYYFPPACSNNNCVGKMHLHLMRSRDYTCYSCGSKVKLPKFQNDAAAKKRVNKLLMFLASIVLMLLTLAIAGIIKNSS